MKLPIPKPRLLISWGCETALTPPHTKMRMKKKTNTNIFESIINNTAAFVSKHDTERNPWVVLYAHIVQLMTHTTNVYIAAAYLAIMLLSLLAYCRG